ncbi:hypothetical protein GCK72_004629 [Caenorhabditis remanei]|uniref:F-box domain-containing protein n=1 Tax=Caenorhabditis remanei TaxID=31234 RepID=A0A6A5HA32_CAERE|nr:hypothetical protein GCK72_004629 [Caenorhabditis remanei]KAF1764680.1 hypothetical protein GCK72_004629 [Caenorhabditis remanei]
MTSNAPKFRLLYLPRLALESVLSNFDHLERFEFSTCSKRCKRVVESLKHGCIEIGVRINHRLTSVTVISGSTLKAFTWFHLFKSPPSGNHQFVTLNGRTIRMTKNPRRVSFYCPRELTVDTKALVDHLVETFRVPIKILEFEMDYFNDYRDFVQCFPKCDNLRISGVWPISEEDITYLQEHVEHNHFYKNGNLQ